jgi:hypothetical protein
MKYVEITAFTALRMVIETVEIFVKNEIYSPKKCSVCTVD